MTDITDLVDIENGRLGGDMFTDEDIYQLTTPTTSRSQT